MQEHQSFNDFVAEVKQKYSIADYIESLNVKVVRNGNSVKSLCLFHSEKTPSMVINEDFQNYRCFGCGANGDIIALVRNYENLSFYDALTKLAEGAGMEMPHFNDAADRPKVPLLRLREIVAKSQEYFRYCFTQLPESHPAKQQVVSRGLNINGYQYYGYAPYLEERLSENFVVSRALVKYLESLGYNEAEILESRMGRKAGRTLVDVFSHRLMFPIASASGAYVGFTGRALSESEKAKYVNTTESPIFKKRKSLFNLELARKCAREKQCIYATEGQFDAISVSESGIENVVAISGTAITEEQIRLMYQSVGDKGRVVICFDGDDAGMRKALSALPVAGALQDSLDIVPMPDGLDPSDLRTQIGDIAFVEYMEANRTSLIDYKMQRALRVWLEDGDRSALRELFSEIYSPVQRDRLKKVASFRLNIPLSSIEEEVGKDTPVPKKPQVKVTGEQEKMRKIYSTKTGVTPEHEYEYKVLSVDTLGWIEKIQDDKRVADSILAKLGLIVLRYPDLLPEIRGLWRFTMTPYRELYARMLQNGVSLPVLPENYSELSDFVSYLTQSDLVSCIDDKSESYEYFYQLKGLFIKLLSNKLRSESIQDWTEERSLITGGLDPEASLSEEIYHQLQCSFGQAFDRLKMSEGKIGRLVE